MVDDPHPLSLSEIFGFFKEDPQFGRTEHRQALVVFAREIQRWLLPNQAYQPRDDHPQWRLSWVDHPRRSHSGELELVLQDPLGNLDLSSRPQPSNFVCWIPTQRDDRNLIAEYLWMKAVVPGGTLGREARSPYTSTVGHSAWYRDSASDDRAHLNEFSLLMERLQEKTLTVEAGESEAGESEAGESEAGESEAGEVASWLADTTHELAQAENSLSVLRHDVNNLTDKLDETLAVLACMDKESR